MGGLPRPFWWLWGGALVSSLATFVFPFLALYLTSRGFDAQRTGLLVSLLGVGALFAGPLGGTLADRLGRKPAVLFALVGSAVAAVWLGLVRAPILVAPGVLAFGLCAMMAFPTLNAMVADVVPPERVQQAYGLLYWANNAGIGLSALIGGALAGKSWTLLFWADALTTLIFAGIVGRQVPESRPLPKEGAPPRGWGVLRRDRTLLAFLCVHLAFLLVFWQFQFALPIAVTRAGLPPSAYGQLVAANCVLIVLTQPFATRLVSALPDGLVLAGAALLVGAGYGAYGLCTTRWQYLGATLVWSLGEVTGLPAASAVVAKLAPEDLRGRYQGAFSLTLSAAMTLAPIAGGAVIDRLGLHALWVLCFGLAAFAGAAHAVLGAARAARATPAPPAAPPSGS